MINMAFVCCQPWCPLGTLDRRFAPEGAPTPQPPPLRAACVPCDAPSKREPGPAKQRKVGQKRQRTGGCAPPEEARAVPEADLALAWRDGDADEGSIDSHDWQLGAVDRGVPAWEIRNRYAQYLRTGALVAERERIATAVLHGHRRCRIWVDLGGGAEHKRLAPRIQLRPLLDRLGI